MPHLSLETQPNPALLKTLAYYLIAHLQADWVAVNETSLAGVIEMLMHGLDFQKRLFIYFIANHHSINKIYVLSKWEGSLTAIVERPHQRIIICCSKMEN
jgi:hypothetical protein